MAQDLRVSSLHYESLRFIITPEIQDDGRVFLTTQIFSYDMGEYKLVGEPKLLTGNNKEAEIRITMKNGDEVRFQVAPHADQ